MLSLLINVLGPVVALVALGALTGQRLGIDTASLARLAYWILGPAFVFDVLASAELQAGVVGRLALAAVAACAAAGVVAWFGSRGLSGGYAVTASTMMTGVYGNVGNAGLAIVVFALGDDALVFASVLMVTINLIGMTFGIALASGQRQSRWAAMGQAVVAPMTLGAIAAVAFSVADANVDGGLELPLLLSRGVGLLSSALIPVMLYTLGMQLVDSGGLRLGMDVAISALAKLAVAPAAAALVGTLLALEGDALGALVIQAAMPPAVFCAVVALEHDLDPPRVTNAVVVLTLLSLVTLPVVLTLVT